MQWQDWVFSIGGFLLLASLVPTLRRKDKPALGTSVMSAVLIAIFAVTMASLGLLLSAVANGGIALAWAVLALQKYAGVRRERHIDALHQIEHELLEVVGRED
jgi:hypothetical protein